MRNDHDSIPRTAGGQGRTASEVVTGSIVAACALALAALLILAVLP